MADLNFVGFQLNFEFDLPCLTSFTHIAIWRLCVGIEHGNAENKLGI